MTNNSVGGITTGNIWRTTNNEFGGGVVFGGAPGWMTLSLFSSENREVSSIFKWVPGSNGYDAIPGHVAVGLGLYVVDDTQVKLVLQNIGFKIVGDEHNEQVIQYYLYDVGYNNPGTSSSRQHVVLQKD